MVMVVEMVVMGIFMFYVCVFDGGNGGGDGDGDGESDASVF